MSIVRLTSRVASCLLLASVLVGCASTPPSQRAVASLESTRAELVHGNAQIDAVLETLNALEAKPADLKPVYRDLVRQVDQLEGQAQRVGNRVRDMRVRASAYRTQWESSNQTISNPELRASAAERAETVRDRYDEIDTRAQEVRAAYEPFITELNDLKTFLYNDLTYAGVSAAQPVFDGARDRATELKERVNVLLQELDEAYTRLSPATAPVR